MVALSIHFTYQFHALRQEQPVAAPSLAPPSSTGRHSTAAVYFITRPQLRTFAPPRITTSRPSRVVTSRRRLSSALVCCRCATCRWLAVAARRPSVITANIVPGRQSPRDPSLPARANSACRVIHVSYRAVITDPRAESRFPARGCEHHGTAGEHAPPSLPHLPALCLRRPAREPPPRSARPSAPCHSRAGVTTSCIQPGDESRVELQARHISWQRRQLLTRCFCAT